MQSTAVEDSMPKLSCEAVMKMNPNPHLQTTSFASPITQPPPSKKRRNLPGNPDPESEVIALSPRSLMATNRFVCEICNKGFQRDQNLQLHRRGHNLPWKLKQRSREEVVKKKVYVCPEPSCVHHDRSRALGDLTGIKKHYYRKHGEKKWKCDKCCKRYAVQSDWKAHSKICGTREYRCDCGTLFSRRDSFITHRAFCDSLSVETSRSIPQNPNLSFQTAPNFIPHLKQEINPNFTWLPRVEQSIHPNPNSIPAPPWRPRVEQSIHSNPSPNPNPNSILASSSSSLMSATSLLQKAAQMGATMAISGVHHHEGAMGSTRAVFPSREEMGTGFVHGLAAFGNKLANVTQGCMELQQGGMGTYMLPSTSGLDMATLGFDDNGEFDGIIDPQENGFRFDENVDLMSSRSSGGGGAGSDGLTRDFLGLRAFQHRDFIDMAGFDQMGSSSYDQNQSSWQS